MSVFSENPYYHQSIKSLIIGFGSLFTDLTINKFDATGTKQQSIRVPIAYGPKNKWLSRLHEDPDLYNNVEIVLPRMSFEISDYRYDASRKIGTVGSSITGTVGKGRAKLYNPVPYDITIQLYSMTKTQEDGLQILEQILPYFAPSMNIVIEIMPVFKIKKTIPILLQGVTSEDSYEGSPDELRTVINTFTFVAQMDLFGPINVSDKVIKIAQANIGLSDNPVSPQTNGEHYIAVVDPSNAQPNTPFVIDESWS